MRNRIFKYAYGIIISLLIAIPSWILGNFIPIIGGPIFAIIIGMIISLIWIDKKEFNTEIFY